MLAELIRTEGERRRAVLGVLLVLFAVTPWILASLLRWREGPQQLAESLEWLASIQPPLVLAVIVGAVVWGTGIWQDEQRSGWIYTLSLPLSRLRLFLLRYAAGLGWLALALAVLALSSAAAAAVADLPRGMHAYPGAFSGSVALISVVLYTLGFVLAGWFERPLVVLLVASGIFLLSLWAVSVLSDLWTARYVELLESSASPFHLLFSFQPLFGF